MRFRPLALSGTRREFMRRLATLAGASAAQVWASSDSAAAVKPMPEPLAESHDTSPAAASPPRNAPVQFTLMGSGTLLPFCIGHVFRQGDFLQEVVTSLPTARVTVKNRWPDGSAKFGIVAGLATLSGSSVITLSSGT